MIYLLIAFVILLIAVLVAYSDKIIEAALTGRIFSTISKITTVIAVLLVFGWLIFKLFTTWI